ncbi:MAG: hypothetical protein KJ626_06495 [Verrucomicrobia bacterium]|nr:hypothetical protein [Verrucomicrobiota bacterium]
MANDTDFIRSIRIVLTHLVKHVEPVDDALLSIGRAYEQGEWKKFSSEKKFSYVKKAQDYLSGDNAVTRHYEEYPHKYSRMRFATFQEHLAEYAQELRKEF